VTHARQVAHPENGCRFTLRRIAALAASLLTVSVLVVLSGPGYLWPLFVFPLLLAAVFFFELGSVLVTLWLGNFLVAYHSLVEPAGAATVRQALLGTVLLFAAGLLLGRLLRRQRAQHDELAASSLTDRLTGLYNYGTFSDHLHTEVTRVDRYGGELALVMLDLDHFKQFNDRHGHETGNALLRRVGVTLATAVRESDHAARYGGEEFAVLICGDETHGYELAERLRRAVEAIAVTARDGQDVFCTVSAGVATYPSGATHETELVERADDALYESKRRGRNRVTVYAGVADLAELPASLTA